MSTYCTCGISANCGGRGFRDHAIGLSQRTCEGKGGIVMAGTVYTRLPEAAQISGWKRKNLGAI